MPSLFSTKLNVYLATSFRGAGKPDHWAIFIASSEMAEDGHTFQIVHGRPCFEYRYHSGVKLSASSALRKCAIIGRVKSNKVSAIEEALKSVRVVNDDDQWNCQNWAREGIAKLESLGYLNPGTAEGLDHILAEAPEIHEIHRS